MYSYFKGIVTEVYADSIVIEVNNIGYRVFVANPFSYEVNNEYKVYLYNQVKEEEYSLYGFKTNDERDIFIKLLNVKGMGPKTCIGMLATGSANGIIDAIERENILYLKKFPKVGEKLARQIILDLKGKIVKDEVIVNDHDFDDLVNVLENLGYKSIEIKKILPNINDELDLESQVKEALKLLLK